MKTIRQQLTRNLLLVIGVLLAGGGTAVYLSTRTALLAQFDAALNAKAQAITTLTEEKKQRIEIEFSDEHMRSFDAGGNDFFELWQADGKPVEHSPSLREAHLTLRQDLSAQPVFWNLTLPDGRLGRAVGMRFNPEDSDDVVQKEATLDAIIIVAATRSDLDHTLATLQWVLAGGGLLLLAATTLIVPRILKRELLPLQQLADEAGSIDATSLASRFSTTGLPGELTPIAARLNELLCRLENSFERERRFSSDVAHEFRTPVAELRSLAELAIKLPDTRTADTDHEVLAVALHLESILTRLLALSRGEQARLQVQIEPVMIGALTQKNCDMFQAKAASRKLRLNCHVPADAVAETDLVLFRSILTNLTDNAVEYAPENSTIEVELTITEGRFTLRVCNLVTDLKEGDLPYLFQRFWRKDAARTTNGHSGLGLPLAKTFASAIGCNLTASFVSPGKLAVTLSDARD
ncbi:MAG: ATP-binding protein [Verrucomicrobiota bacterium]